MAKATPRSTYNQLAGRWYRVGTLPNGDPTFPGDAVLLVGQNGYFATYRRKHAPKWAFKEFPVYVVTTGQYKGVWVRATTIDR